MSFLEKLVSSVVPTASPDPRRPAEGPVRRPRRPEVPGVDPEAPRSYRSLLPPKEETEPERRRRDVLPGVYEAHLDARAEMALVAAGQPVAQLRRLAAEGSPLLHVDDLLDGAHRVLARRFAADALPKPGAPAGASEGQNHSLALYDFRISVLEAGLRLGLAEPAVSGRLDALRSQRTDLLAHLL